MTMHLFCCFFVLSLTLFCVSSQLVIPPFFYLCNFHGKSQELGVDSGQVAVTVSLKGSPKYYIPGQIYEVNIQSTMNFDGFLVTGLYTLSDSARDKMSKFGGLGTRPLLGHSLMCSVVHSYVAKRPIHHINFNWIAPSAGTGCVSFIATATLGRLILFKDKTVFQICEYGDSTSVSTRPLLAGIHSDGLVFRDDFESSGKLDRNLWMFSDGGAVDETCGTIMYGQSVTFCDFTSPTRQLGTVPLNLTTASILQFSLSSGECKESASDPPIIVQYGVNNCTDWINLRTVTPPGNRSTTHIIALPAASHRRGVCIRWHQASTWRFAGCWAIDNILINSVAETLSTITDHFDPVESGNWLFFPGAHFTSECQSNGNAMTFSDQASPHNFVTTRDLDLEADTEMLKSDALLFQSFDQNILPGWEVLGGSVRRGCAKVAKDFAMVMEGRAGRHICSPYIHNSAVDNLRFYFVTGCQGAKVERPLKKASIIIYMEDRDGNTDIITKLSPLSHYRLSLISLPIKSLLKRKSTRFCWIQKFHRGYKRDVWALDQVYVLPHLPSSSLNRANFVAQFKMQLQCGIKPAPNRWTAHTLPLPYSAMTPFTRFRWSQADSMVKPNWAIDDVYIGRCAEMCSGHGECTGENSCKCDFGYYGPTCSQNQYPNSPTLVESFNEPSHKVQSNGATLTYDCGILSTGKALVFKKAGLRSLVTSELNTTLSKYVQFSLRIGSDSQISSCPAPSDNRTSVFLLYSCDGAITWHPIKEFTHKDYTIPRLVTVELPDAARAQSCQLRLWQPDHEGTSRDVWALDDISVTPQLLNVLTVDLRDPEDAVKKITMSGGLVKDGYCDMGHSFRFDATNDRKTTRSLTTRALRIGPSSIVQFTIAVGCDLHPHTLDSLSTRVRRSASVQLQYSTDHGMTWTLVRDVCLPPESCGEYAPASTYDVSGYTTPSTVTLPLPRSSWSPHTRLRLIQNDPSITWGVSYLYVGQACREMCRGHGLCHDGQCWCNDGYHGDTCEPSSPLNESLHADFGVSYKPRKDFMRIKGAEIVSSTDGCKTVLSGESLYFSGNGLRELVTKDLNTSDASFIQFYLRQGGGDRRCNLTSGRNSTVLVQYSTNGGITWHHLNDLHAAHFTSPKLVRSELPADAQTDQTRFRLWQPAFHDAADQWAVDEVIVDKDHKLAQLFDNFDDRLMTSDGALSSGMWMTVTDGIIAKYCHRTDGSLVLGNQNEDKVVVTRDVKLKAGDVIQFKINVGCSSDFSWGHPVMLQYSTDKGHTWNLVKEPCYPGQQCPPPLQEGSMYYPGTHGAWRLVVIPITAGDMTRGPIQLKWKQTQGDGEHFALDDVYVGPACPYNCHMKGVCSPNATCTCDAGYEGRSFDESDYRTPYCTPPQRNPAAMTDRFDNINSLSSSWDTIKGGQLDRACGKLDYGKSLYFGESGTREVLTRPLDTTNLRKVQFHAKIGDPSDKPRCSKPKQRTESIVLDYSTDNTVSWTTLKVIEPKYEKDPLNVVSVDLPSAAKTNSTIIRWWQPLGFGDSERAQWALDTVIIGHNDTISYSFNDKFDSMMPNAEHWYATHDAVPRVGCRGDGSVLEFSRNYEGTRFAETWDYHLTPSTFLQFDLSLGCGRLHGDDYAVHLDYSTDYGKTWQPLVDKCEPPKSECASYKFTSQYRSGEHKNWTRVTVSLPKNVVSAATRFRWRQISHSPRDDIWALDNVYLGDGCEWMCSGHGSCDAGVCRCDSGYGGKYCVPTKPLPMMMRDDFNQPISKHKWPQLYGGHVTDRCGIVASKEALTFFKDSLRLGVTADMDTSMVENMEFFFKYGCLKNDSRWAREHSVLLQSSSNGGISWKLLQEIYFTPTNGTRFYSVALPPEARYNSTRFRFWQPNHPGHKAASWAIDNLFIGTMAMKPSSLYETFDKTPSSDYWLFVNNGQVSKYCPHLTRLNGADAGLSALLFDQGHGEMSVTTRDMYVGATYVMQFEINLGCGSEPNNKYPVKLQYSQDGGVTWQLLVGQCTEHSQCASDQVPPTVYYPGDSRGWRRIAVPLNRLTCGPVRFRWHQEAIPNTDYGPQWAIDRVHIGPACTDQCSGHGYCLNGMACMCDTGYTGHSCKTSKNLASYLKEDFDSHRPSDATKHQKELDTSKWSSWTGGRVSDICGIVMTQLALVFQQAGHRLLITQDLDLSRASIIQFHLHQACGSPIGLNTAPIFLQYSTDGGIHWTTLEQFTGTREKQPQYHVVRIPQKARHNSTRIQWWQPSVDGTFNDSWAIDQIYIGGDYEGVKTLQDDAVAPTDSNWITYTSGVIEPFCDYKRQAIHFKEKREKKYAVSADVAVTDQSYLQFELNMGCQSTVESCFSVDLEYSLDYGKTWHLVIKSCLPSNVDCGTFYSSSVYRSDQFQGWKRVSLKLPYYTRSAATRFRWIQKIPNAESWALRRLYVGASCPGLCSGRGICVNHNCSCDDNWRGATCDISAASLPTSLIETFDRLDMVKRWDVIVGGSVTQGCRVLASGKLLQFAGKCSRMLITKPLNLTSAVFVQFLLMFGCNTAPMNRDETVLLDYTVDNGISWSPIAEVPYALYQKPRFISYKLPGASKTNRVQIRWWQPLHGGLQLSDWSIDNVHIGGERPNPDTLFDDFSSGQESILTPDTKTKFLKGDSRKTLTDTDRSYGKLPQKDGVDVGKFPFTDGLKRGRFCGKDDTLTGSSSATEAAAVTSRDMNIQPDSVIQFGINVGCRRGEGEPVNVEYSTDNGVSWDPLVRQCLHSDRGCDPGHTSTKSSYFADDQWRIVTVPLKHLENATSVRFRWYQAPTNDKTPWAISHIFIGQSCVEGCSNHGVCTTRGCLCHYGYSGDICGTPMSPFMNGLKDAFKTPTIDGSLWHLVQGGGIRTPCIPLVHGTAMVLDGVGLRQIVTGDMDLRDSTFVSFWAVIGGYQSSALSDRYCLRASSEHHNVILQFSTDHGVTWKTLHTLDYSSFSTPRRQYIKLPLEARTKHTRLRWWQPLMKNWRKHPAPSWALDNVLIGGSEINPSILRESFDGNTTRDSYEFSPFGGVKHGVCGGDGRSMLFTAGNGNKYVTTRQMIVQKNYFIQFDIVVGCGSGTCSPSAVHLEYNRQPRRDDWHPVHESCVPGGENEARCVPGQHHAASVYHRDVYHDWTRVTLPLYPHVFGSSVRFRWRQTARGASAPAWAVDNWYIGDQCPGMCSGRGVCVDGQCVCDAGYFGKSCLPPTSRLPSEFRERFESALSDRSWHEVRGGQVGFACRSLYPHAYGKNLYFSGCGTRLAVTVELNLIHARRLVFVVQIGSRKPTRSCNLDLSAPGASKKGVLLQYTLNKGVEWTTLAYHSPLLFRSARRVSYNLPAAARVSAVQFRWWQPAHGLADHWAIDQIEIVTSGYNRLSASNQQYGK